MAPVERAGATAVFALCVLAAATAARGQEPAGGADPQKYLAKLAGEMKVAWPNNRTLKFVCHGHSVPAGYFKTPVVDTFNAYPHLWHVAIKERYPHAVLNVINTAIGGENSASGAKRFESDVLALKPDLITIDYALNDRGLGVPRSRELLTAMIDQARAKGIPVLLLTPTPDQRAKLDDPNDPLNQQAEMIRALAGAKQVGLVDSYAAFKRKIQAGTRLEDLMSQVNHPNRAGHELVVAELLKWLP